MARRLPKFHDFIGQRPQVAVLRRQLAGAKARIESFPATLFLGPSGVGKTLLAAALAAEYGTTLIRADGHDSPHELAGKFMGLKKFDFVFIDELHSASTDAQEMLFQVVDDFRIPRWALPTKTGGPGGETGEWSEIQPCTLIGATNQPGQLLNALLKRMELVISLRPYSLVEMQEITDLMAKNLNMLLSPQARNAIARVAGGLPRRAKYLLQNLRRHWPNSEREEINLPQARQFLVDFGIDENGLDSLHQSYMQYVADVEHASMPSLALRLDLDEAFVQQTIEPPLLHMGLVSIGSGGRSLTEAGHKYLGELMKQQNGGDNDGHD